MVSAWRNFKNIFSRPLFTIIFRPEVLKFHPYSILTRDTMVGFVIFCVLKCGRGKILIVGMVEHCAAHCSLKISFILHPYCRVLYTVTWWRTWRRLTVAASESLQHRRHRAAPLLAFLAVDPVNVNAASPSCFPLHSGTTRFFPHTRPIAECFKKFSSHC